MKKTGASRIVTDAMLAAMYVVLSSWLSLSLWNLKLSVDALPILVAGLLFGPVDGFAVGFVGEMLSQILGPYGLAITSPLWAVPPAVRGLIAGLYMLCAKDSLKRPGLFAMLSLSALLVTGLTTAVMALDAKLLHYAFAATIPSVIWRVISGLILAVAFTAILPPILRRIRSAMHMDQKQ